jgi:hypothetical protein
MMKPSCSACAVVAGALSFFVAITLPAESNAEDNTPASPSSGAPAVPQAPVTSGLLTWQIRDVTDKMTDVTSRKALSGGVFDDGISLEASATCDKIGVEFAFDTFRDHKPAQFAWQEDEIALRARIDGGAVRTARAKAEYNNEVKIAFYDPAVAERLIRAATPSADRDNPIAGPFNSMMGNAALNVIEAAAAGKLSELGSARSIRVELPLANGNAYVVDLNPQDHALGSIVRQCMTDLQASTPPPQPSKQELTPTLPLIHPKQVTLRKTLRVYLMGPNGFVWAKMEGGVTILGQYKGSRDFFCVVKGRTIDGREVTGLTPLSVIGDALPDDQSGACSMPQGASQ